jgi:hypothetical protein
MSEKFIGPRRNEGPSLLRVITGRCQRWASRD